MRCLQLQQVARSLGPGRSRAAVRAHAPLHPSRVRSPLRACKRHAGVASTTGQHASHMPVLCCTCKETRLLACSRVPATRGTQRMSRLPPAGAAVLHALLRLRKNEIQGMVMCCWWWLPLLCNAVDGCHAAAARCMGKPAMRNPPGTEWPGLAHLANSICCWAVQEAKRDLLLL